MTSARKCDFLTMKQHCLAFENIHSSGSSLSESKVKTTICSSSFLVHTPSQWSDMASGVLCGGHRQSPINIVRIHASIDHKLLNFSFTNFSDQHALKSLFNNGHTGGGLIYIELSLYTTLSYTASYVVSLIMILTLLPTSLM